MEPADFYSGIVVDAYAKLRGSTFNADPYIDFVKAHGEPGLEIGCGAGEPLLDLCAVGLDVDGVDSSLDMVQRCRENALQRGLSLDVFHQRVEDLDLNRLYSAIYFAGPTFNLLADDETALRALARIAKHLTGGGAALIPLWVPEPTAAEVLGVALAAEDEDVELRYTPLSETYDSDGRTRVTACRYERVVDGQTEVADREWVIHWQTPTTMSDLCDRAGLEVVSMIDDDTNEVASNTSEGFTATVRLRTRVIGSPVSSR